MGFSTITVHDEDNCDVLHLQAIGACELVRWHVGIESAGFDLLAAER